MTKGCCGSGCPDCPFRPPSQGGLFYAYLPKYKVVTGTNPQGFPCTGNRTYNASRTNVATSGGYGKNYGMLICTVKRQKRQGKTGVNASLSLVK